MMLGKNEILKLFEKYKIIYPFDLNLLDGESYVLTVKEEVIVPYMSHKNVLSHEIVFIPPEYVGFLSIKSKYGRAGLFFSGAVKVHSGWIGRPVLEVLNVNDEHKSITIKRGDPFVHLSIEERKGEPSPYLGAYQYQAMDEEEIEMFRPYMEKAWKDAGLNFSEYEKKVRKAKFKF